MKEKIKHLADKLGFLFLYYRPFYVLLNIAERLLSSISNGKPIIVYPSINTASSQMLYRLSYYFKDNVVYYSGDVDKVNESPEYFGRDIALSSQVKNISRFKVLLSIFTFKPILVWDATSILSKIILLLPTSVNCCYKTNGKEGWNYFRLFNRVNGVITNNLDFSTIPSTQSSLVLGTGPSIDNISPDEAQESTVIICNTIVKNTELCKMLNPKFVVFADAVYHFGPSIYAEAFRHALRNFLKQFPECKALIPEVFYHHFSLQMSESSERIYSIPFADDRRLHLDYRACYNVHRTENILNQMLTPLANTVSTEVIKFVGFDGRSSSDKGFWSHSQRNNFVELLEFQKDAHPSFFYKKDLAFYAIRQGSNTEKIFSTIEKSGKRIVSLNESTNPAMAKRFKN